MTPTTCGRDGCDPKTTLLPSGIGYVVRCDVCGRRGPVGTLMFWSPDDDWEDWESEEERVASATGRAEGYWNKMIETHIEETGT